MDAQIPNAWVLISPHDTNPIAGGCIGILVGSTAGNIVARTAGNATDVTIPVVANQLVPGRFTHVRSTGTTATTLHAAV
jgi:hypothetical protein